MKTTIYFLLLCLLIGCKSDLVVPDPPKPKPEPEYRDITFNVRNDHPPQYPKNKMKIEIGDWDTIVELNTGYSNYLYKGELLDTVSFYAWKSPGAYDIKTTEIAIEKNDTAKWSKFVTGETIPDTLKTVILK